jgi:hypothetical protein
LFSSRVLHDIFAPENTLVIATDLPRPGTGGRLGALINLQTHAIFQILIVNLDGGLDGDPVIVQPPPIAASPAVAAVSGLRQEIAFFGERDLKGNVIQSVRTYDFDLGKTITWPIISATKLQNPAAAAYRAEDDAYWLLDRIGTPTDPKLRLLRLSRGAVADPIAECARPGRHTNFALTAGAEGSLVVSAWNMTKHAIAVISVNGLTPSLRALYFGRDPIVVPAYKSLDGINFATRSKDGSVVPQKQIVRTQHEPDLDDDQEGEHIDPQQLSRAM